MPTAKKNTSSNATTKAKAAKTTGKKSSKKASKATKEIVEEEIVEEEIIEEVVEKEVVEKEGAASAPVVKSRAVTKEYLEASFDELISDLQDEIEKLRPDVKKGGTGVRFLGRIKTRLSKLKTQSLKIAKGKKKVTNTNPNSGFKKPVVVSKDVQKFAGWKEDELHSRIDVTKFICDYIKTNSLQNPDDKRRIIPDKKLRTLLGAGEEVKDFRYCDIQSMMKHHYIKKE
jgi:chromatin remodeling complex protein RSC6